MKHNTTTEKNTKKITQMMEKQILAKTDIDQVLSDHQEDLIAMSLSEYLDTLLIKYHANKKAILARTFIDLSYGYQIFNGTKQKPRRDYLLQIAFAFPLDVKETKHLLYYGNAASLYPRVKRDAYLMYALHNGFSLYEVNDYLKKNTLEPFQEE